MYLLRRHLMKIIAHGSAVAAIVGPGLAKAAEGKKKHLSLPRMASRLPIR